jgi:glycosyltransferase involved in cell wall biosynthesis
MAAADLLVHPSILESSCVVVKEAALVQLPVVVCEGIGDFDDYMKNGVNGVVVSVENFVDEAFVALQNFSRNPKEYKDTATQLHNDILKLFNIDTVFGQYEKLVGV